ncbi:RNA polymerase sigma factor [Pedobacter sp.]|uniref:RNA polymerase sigma factor n=1 Tax=Pedobacter sp. TaxID=1411316 RepID=UPI00396C7034
MNETVNTYASHLFRENYGKMVSYLSQQYGYQEIDNIIDAVQEAFEVALIKWRFSGLPDKPLAWLFKVANNKLLNQLKKANTHKRHIQGISTNKQIDAIEEKEFDDSLFRLLLLFSKLRFKERNKIIISLYFLCGFGYAEIAAALFLNAEAVKKVILRSKDSIKQFTLKHSDNLNATDGTDLGCLVRILYLMFNEGYKSAKKNETIDLSLCYEAIRLGKMVAGFEKENRQINALIALMFFNTSRFPARIKENTWISLEEQDRSLWNKELISEGFYYLREAKNNQDKLNKYYLEALISSLHCIAPTYADTDWLSISFLYHQLENIEPNSITIKLNRIIAESNYKAIVLLIDELKDMEPAITEGFFTYYSCLAYLYAKNKQLNKAYEYYNLCMSYSRNKADQNFIGQKLKALKKHLNIKK